MPREIQAGNYMTSPPFGQTRQCSEPDSAQAARLAALIRYGVLGAGWVQDSRQTIS
jgi:hypothetical protein